MKKTRAVRTKRFLLGTTFALAVLVCLSGCIAVATIATIAYVKSRLEHTAVVELDVTPQEVYGAMERVAAATTGLEFKKQDPINFIMKVKNLNNNNVVMAQAKLLDNGKTQFKVTASAKEEELRNEELALGVVELVCDELGVKYKVVEEKGLLK